MSASIEYALISKVAETHDFHTLEKQQITADFFTVPEMRDLYNCLRDIYHAPETAGIVPSVDMIRQFRPGFTPVYAPDEVSMLCQALRESKVRMDILSLSSKLQLEAERDPKTALSTLKYGAQALAATAEVSQDLHMSGVYQQLMERYSMVSTAGGILGIPFPWDALNAETQGMQGGQFIVLYGRPKSMKCVCEGQRLMMENGALVPIEQVPETTIVPSYTEKTKKVRWAEARRVVSGMKNCIETETESGLRLRTSEEHLYMVPGGGYSRIKNLKPGDYIATVRKLPEWKPNSNGITYEDAHLLGLLVGDGNYTRHEVQFTTQDEDILSTLKERVKKFDCDINSGYRDIEYRIVGNKHGKNKILDFLRELGIHGQKSEMKRVPERIFRSSRAAIAAFLAGLLDTNGHVSSKHLLWSSASRGLLEDLQHLLMRFGVRGRLSEVTTNYGTQAYNLIVYSRELCTIIDKEIGPFVVLRYKREALKRLAASERKEKRNTDAIPYTNDLRTAILHAKGTREWPSWGTSKFDASKLFRRTNRISRKMLLWLAESFESPELKEVASTDIVWEQIEAITPLGQIACYDICITDRQDPNFVVEGFIVHNTWLAIYTAVHAYLKSRRRVLFYTREMPPFQIAQRVAACMCGVSYRAFRNGTLEPGLFAYVQSTLQGLVSDEISAGKHGHQPCFIITSDRSRNGGGVSWLQAKIREMQPDIVFVDGMYLMKDDRTDSRNIDWKNVAHISQDLKFTSQEFDIPVVGVTQANRKSENVRSDDMIDIAYADALAQDADAVFRVKLFIRRDESTQGAKKTELWLYAPGLREGQLDGIVLNGEPASDFSFIKPIVIEENVEEAEYGKDKKKQSVPKPGGATFRSNPSNYFQSDPSIGAMKR